MRLSASQHSACRSSSSRCPHAVGTVSARALLHSRPLAHAAATSSIDRRSTTVPSSGTCPASRRGSSGRVRSPGVICRDAPRPMWARKSPPPEAPKQIGSQLERMITSQIRNADSVAELENVFNEWGGSFNHIHASAAFVRCSKLPGGARSMLIGKLSSVWLSLLDVSDLQGLANVLGASAKLGTSKGAPQLWGPTWAVFIQRVQQLSDSNSNVPAQQLANPLWACAKLSQQPTAAELQLLMQAILHPDALAAVKPLEISNIAWALGKLCQLPGWQGGVSELDVQQLLGKEQLQLVAADGNNQDRSNVLVALAGMSARDVPLISKAFAQDCAAQVLAVAYGYLAKGTSQQVSNSLWACGELGLSDMQFISAAVSEASNWLPNSMGRELTQSAAACAQLQYRNEAFLQLLLTRGVLLVQQQSSTGRPGSRHTPTAAEKASIAALCSVAVANLDMQTLAGTAKGLVAASEIGRLSGIHPANLRHLWVFHSWLLQQQLLDGKGLSGLLTQQQLRQGQEDAAVFRRK